MKTEESHGKISENHKTKPKNTMENNGKINKHPQNDLNNHQKRSQKNLPPNPASLSLLPCKPLPKTQTPNAQTPRHGVPKTLKNGLLS